MKTHIVFDKSKLKQTYTRPAVKTLAAFGQPRINTQTKLDGLKPNTRQQDPPFEPEGGKIAHTQRNYILLQT